MWQSPPSEGGVPLGSNVVLLVIGVPLMLSFHSSSSGTRAAGFTETLIRLMAIGLLCQAVFYYAELYNLQIARNVREQIWRMLGAMGVVMLVLATVFWAAPDLSPGRDALLGLPLASTAVLVLTRGIAVPARSSKVALVGPESSCALLRVGLAQYPEWNLEVVGSLCSDNVCRLPSKRPGSDHSFGRCRTEPGFAPSPDPFENARRSRGERCSIF